MNPPFYNLGASSLAIAFTLGSIENHTLSLSKALLVTPFVTNQDLLGYLAHRKVKTRSLEKIIIENPNYFTNFNGRFYDSLTTSINAIQLLADIDAVCVSAGTIVLTKKIEYHKDMGKRANKVHLAAPNLAELLHDSAEKLYLNLRVEI